MKLTTNVTPKEKKRTLTLYKEDSLHKYLELYEQIFDIDLYAYRVSFQYGKGFISKLQDIPREELLARIKSRSLEV